jgi:Protein of unknown function (DUF2735)
MTEVSPNSAQIFQFPPRGRFAGASSLGENKFAVSFTLPDGGQTVFGSAWYHDEAVQDDARMRKN